MNDHEYDAILDEILEAGERGAELSFEELLAAHPGQEADIRRALSSFDGYRRFREEAARPDGAAAGELAAGERLGDFEIVDRLAAGGMGVVYRARQLSLGRRIVALKVLASSSAGLHGAARFQREALQLAGLHHPHLAEVYGFGEAQGRLFLAMRLVEGANLRDILEQRATQRDAGNDPRELRRVVERVAEVADALALAHARGLVHRDVKPSNIVLEESDRSAPLRNGAVLVDFGLARPVDERVLTLSGASPATPSYAPPEQLLGQAVDARADVFSLGVTLHDLLSARRPTERPQASAGLEPIEQLAPSVDRDLAAVVTRAVDPEARWRYPDAAAFRDDLRAWLAGAPVSARSLPWRERALRSLARNPRRIVRATILAAALIVAVVGFSLGPGAELQELRKARDRYARGDLLEFARAANDLSGVTATLVGRGDTFGGALARVRTAKHDDPVRRTLDALEANDVCGALVEAATTLGGERNADNELLERSFLACELDAAMRARLRERDVDMWAILLARLFYERPVESLLELERCEAYRDALTSAWARSDLSATARSYLATAWGGLGAPEYGVLALLPPIVPPETSLEQVRLHLHNTTRILRRAVVMGIADRTPFEACWSCLEPIAERIHELDEHDQPHSIVAELMDAVTALVFAHRSSGSLPPPFVQWRALERWRDMQGRSPGWWNAWSRPLAAAQAPELLERLTQHDPTAFLDAHDSAQLGWMSGAVTSRAGLPLSLEQFVASHRPPDERKVFADAAATALEAARGRVQKEVLDADTLFGWKPSSAELETLSGRRDPDGAPDYGPMPSVEFDPVEHRESLSVVEVRTPDAEWWFRAQEARWRGDAQPPRAVAARIETDGDEHFLVLHAFGLSELELSFVIAKNSLALPRWLVLRLQTNGRNGYPNLGDSWLQVSLNDAALDSTSAFRDHPTQMPIALPWSGLRTGVNRVRLRLLATSTTPLRVHDARVTTARPSK
jgi:serine/threonine protein kinase